DAPALDGIGARLREDWIARWVADPRAIRPDAHMPQIRIASRPENARAIAAYLASTGTNSNATPQAKLTSVEIKRAQALFENQHCDACHYTEGVGTPELKKVSLSNVASKFYPSALQAYIEKPDAFYKWTAMPRFRLGSGDAELLARWLISRSLSFASTPSASTPQVVEHGNELVQSLGCLNCHAMNLPNKFATMPLARVEATHGGCIGSQPTIDFGFAPVERSAIDLWLSNQRNSLTRNVPIEFAERHYARLRCVECHQRVEGVPGLDRLGEKLKPEWMGRFIAGDIAQKPRPWLASQMPAFPQFGGDIGRGLAEASGFAPRSRTNAPVAELAKIGGQLVQAPPTGLACVQCHANGATMPTVSDAPGMNFAFIAARLQPSYFQRWVRKPSVIDPHTKMPSYFTDEGTSPLKQYFGGDADKQIAAIWEYLQTRHE
ncbi:MAG: Trehalose utilization, partial [Verrucomicrobiales bacterium]|nr:Trehalose utilization [Verrucomicrobiales bacterium]